jgi:hydrogenase maturation protease
MIAGPASNALCDEFRRAGVARLIIGYGNDLRSDDGAGIRVATMIAARDLKTRVITCHQLTPELADDIALAEQVVFIDAYSADEHGARLRVERLSDGDVGCAQGHRGDPAALLALARRLNGRVPDAWVVGVPAYCFDAGETISRATAQRIDEVAAWFGQ